MKNSVVSRRVLASGIREAQNEFRIASTSSSLVYMFHLRHISWLEERLAEYDIEHGTFDVPDVPAVGLRLVG